MTKPQMLALVVAGSSLLVLSVLAALTDYLALDPPLTRLLQQSLGWVEPIMDGAAWLGSTTRILGVLGIGTLALAYTKREYVLAPFVVALTIPLVPLLKDLIGRPRPGGDLIQVYAVASGNSFPSGHAFMSMAILGLFFYLAGYLSGGVRMLTIGLRVLTAGTIVAIGVARVYLGVHWTSDVVGGYLMGAVVLALLIPIVERIAARVDGSRGGS